LCNRITMEKPADLLEPTMSAMRVWIDDLFTDKPRLLVWKNECFYCGRVTDTDKAAWEDRLRDTRDPAKEIGPGCQVAPIQLVTRIEVDGDLGEARIYYGKTGMSEITFRMSERVNELVLAVRESRPDWQL